MWYFFPLVRQVWCDWRNPCNLLIFKKNHLFHRTQFNRSFVYWWHPRSTRPVIGWSYSFQSDFFVTDKTNKKFKSISTFFVCRRCLSCSYMILTVSQKLMVHKQTFWRTFIIFRQEFHTKNIKYTYVRILKRLNNII